MKDEAIDDEKSFIWSSYDGCDWSAGRSANGSTSRHYSNSKTSDCARKFHALASHRGLWLRR
jgi:hypothetical protein